MFCQKVFIKLDLVSGLFKQKKKNEIKYFKETEIKIKLFPLICRIFFIKYKNLIKKGYIFGVAWLKFGKEKILSENGIFIK